MTRQPYEPLGEFFMRVIWPWFIMVLLGSLTLVIAAAIVRLCWGILTR